MYIRIIGTAKARIEETARMLKELCDAEVAKGNKAFKVIRGIDLRRESYNDTATVRYSFLSLIKSHEFFMSKDSEKACQDFKNQLENYFEEMKDFARLAKAVFAFVGLIIIGGVCYFTDGCKGILSEREVNLPVIEKGNAPLNKIK